MLLSSYPGAESPGFWFCYGVRTPKVQRHGRGSPSRGLLGCGRAPAHLAIRACVGRSPGSRWGSRSGRRHPRSARLHAASQCDRSVSRGLSLTKHEITFNHKPNVNECNQVIRMCGGVIFTTCSDALIMLCKIMLKIELCKKRPCSAKADDSEVQRLDRFNISFMKRCV